MKRRRTTGSGFAFAVLGAVALIACVVLSLCQRSPPPPSAAPSATREAFPNFWPDPPPADVAALLDGLGPNAALVGRWRVRGISPVSARRITVDVDNGDAGFRVWIVKQDADPRRPPATTARYALYSAQPRPFADSIDDEMRDQVLRALAERIKRTENLVPTPAGM